MPPTAAASSSSLRPDLHVVINLLAFEPRPALRRPISSATRSSSPSSLSVERGGIVRRLPGRGKNSGESLAQCGGNFGYNAAQMARPWEYPRWRRVLMQVAMWVIFGGTLGLAQLVVRQRQLTPIVLEPRTRLGPLWVRFATGMDAGVWPGSDRRPKFRWQTRNSRGI